MARPASSRAAPEQLGICVSQEITLVVVAAVHLSSCPSAQLQYHRRHAFDTRCRLRAHRQGRLPPGLGHACITDHLPGKPHPCASPQKWKGWTLFPTLPFLDSPPSPCGRRAGVPRGSHRRPSQILVPRGARREGPPRRDIAHAGDHETPAPAPARDSGSCRRERSPGLRPSCNRCARRTAWMYNSGNLPR